ncbi:MAG: NUDIX domain-containing protein, partial [Chroococcales cyanobacterium metabat2.561]
MMQMYKVFTNNKTIIISDLIPKEYLSSDLIHVIEGLDLNALHDLDNLTALSDYETILILAPDPDALKRRLFEKYYPIKAAGGLVINKKADLLVIFRRGVWDLPKGKTDLGESGSEAALREVEEETSIQAAITSETPVITTHIYKQ